MNMNCNIAGDLLPLYADGACSPDSRRALEEHLAGCPACREKLERMRQAVPPEAPGITPPRLKTYAKKVRWRRAALGALGVLAMALALFCGSVLMDMYYSSHPVVPEVEEGTVNLTAGSATAAAEEAEQMVFYTNSQRIQITVAAEGDFSGEVFLRCDGHDILHGHVNHGSNSVTFTSLTARLRYQVRFEGLEGAAVTVSDGRIVSFWQGVKNVLGIL